MVELNLHYLKEHDREQKVLTARSVEAILETTGDTFEEVFGLDRTVKAFMHDSGTVAGLDPTRIALQAEQLRKELYKSNPTASKEDIEVLLFKQLQDAFGVTAGTEAEVQAKIASFQDDAFLNIGDPYMKIGVEVDLDRVHMLDYEYGDEGTTHRFRSATDVAEAVRNSLYYKGVWESSLAELEYWMEDYPDSTQAPPHVRKLVEGGYEEDKGDVPPLRELVDNAMKAIALYEETGREEELLHAKWWWKDVDDIFENYRREQARYLEQLKQNDPAAYEAATDTTWGYNPADNAARQARYMTKNALGGFDVLEHYHKDVYPRLLREHFERICTAFAPETGPYSEEQVLRNIALTEWARHVEASGYRLDQLHPYEEGQIFTGLVESFFGAHGLEMLKHLDRELYDMIDDTTSDALRKKFPLQKTPEHAHADRGVFPQTQSMYDSEAYDRILASWSVSAHMFETMSTQDLTTIVWPEFDRLLRKGGSARIFPIAYAMYNDNKDRILQSLEEYLKNAPHLSYEVKEGWDLNGGSDKLVTILTLRKAA